MKWRVSHSLSCEENDTANQEPPIMFFTCRLYQGVSRLTVTCSDSLFTPFGKLWKSSLRALYQVELLTKDDWGKICHLSNFCGGFFAIESIQKHKRENKPRIETVHVQIIFATKRARISSSMDLSALCSTKSRRRSWTLKLLKYVMFHVWEVFLYFHLLSVPLHHFYQLGNLYGLHLPWYFNEPLTRIFLALKRMSLKKK